MYEAHQVQPALAFCAMCGGIVATQFHIVFHRAGAADSASVQCGAAGEHLVDGDVLFACRSRAVTAIFRIV